MENTTQNIEYLPIPKIDEWNKFQDDYKLLKNQLEISKKQLEKYTNNDRHKRYYEKNKERVKENAKNYLNRLKEENPDKLKEYRHKAYMKRKMIKE
jgi:hypothetical protein